MSYVGLRPVTQTLSTATQYFNGDGTTLQFTLQQGVGKASDIIVSVGNTLQVPGNDYTATGTALIFNAGKAPTAGTNNVAVTFISSSLQTLFVTANAYPIGNSVQPAIYSVTAAATGIYWPSTTSMAFTASGNTRVTVSDDSSGVASSTSTGALRVSGGMGVTGNVAIGGTFIRSSWDVGEVIATRVYNNSDLNMQSTNTIGITSYVTIATITYTPKSSSSFLWIEFDAHYDFNGGSAVDDFFSRITVGGSTIMEKNQIFIFASGGGTRSGVLFPISGRYTNTSTSGIAITVQARRGTADDNLRVYGSATSGYMRIQEIGR